LVQLYFFPAIGYSSLGFFWSWTHVNVLFPTHYFKRNSCHSWTLEVQALEVWGSLQLVEKG
jgi:hypothetical protein